MGEKILFVDDEPAVLDGFKRMLHREFSVETAVGGEPALAMIREQGPYAVVVSDMRMPGMDGVQFLTRVRQDVPDTVRMILTGYADMKAAMDAVNEGNIFRFLTKPCEKEVLGKALTTALVQYRLVRAEKELLENTLMGSIKVLTDVLSAVSPAAFGRSLRIARYVRHMTKKFQIDSAWQLEVAAMLSQLGCITLDPELVESAYIGAQLSPEDQERFDAHPKAARDLLINIPRLEPIAWMIAEQGAKAAAANAPETSAPRIPSFSKEVMAFGARMLKLAIAFDNQIMKGASDEEAKAKLQYRAGEFGKELMGALADLESEGAATEVRLVQISKLATGMVLQQEVRTHTGLLVVAKGQEVSHPLLIRLENFAHRRAIDDKVLVRVPVVAAAKAQGQA